MVALFRSDERDDLAVGIERHAEAARVPGRHGLAERGHALLLAGRVLVVRGIVRGLRERVDHVLRCGLIGIADAEADDVDAAFLRLAHLLADLHVEVWR